MLALWKFYASSWSSCEGIKGCIHWFRQTPDGRILQGWSHGIASGLGRSSQKQLAIWLGGCSAWVFSMVVLGGLTRLTRSGLSMTDWKFAGERPPANPVRVFSPQKVPRPAAPWGIAVARPQMHAWIWWLPRRINGERSFRSTRNLQSTSGWTGETSCYQGFTGEVIRTIIEACQVQGSQQIKFCVMLLQKHEPGRIQVHLLDGVRSPHVGPFAGFGICWAGCLLCCKGQN